MLWNAFVYVSFSATKSVVCDHALPVGLDLEITNYYRRRYSNTPSEIIQAGTTITVTSKNTAGVIALFLDQNVDITLLEFENPDFAEIRLYFQPIDGDKYELNKNGKLVNVAVNGPLGVDVSRKPIHSS